MERDIYITFTGGTDINQACREALDLYIRCEGRHIIKFNFNGVEVSCKQEDCVQELVDEYFEDISELKEID